MSVVRFRGYVSSYVSWICRYLSLMDMSVVRFHGYVGMYLSWKGR
jgi:hypothetical protein